MSLAAPTSSFRYMVRSSQDLTGRLDWSLSVKRRTVEHGHSSFAVEAQRTMEVKLAFKAPEVKEGVILETELNVAAYAADDRKLAACPGRKIWVFPRDPFANRGEWLKRLKITLFDPEGKTAGVLEKANVPFTYTKNPSALDELSEGMLVIGEGTAWSDYRSLGESMVKAAARGLPVLCLAPGEGAVVLPGTAGAELPPPARLTLRQAEIIAELDKRLDSAAWPPKGVIDSSCLEIKSDRDQVVAKASGQAGAWPWLEMQYPAGKGRLLVCGFGIIRQWEATPAPRYLLSELFLRLSGEKQSTLSIHEERKN